MAPQGPEIQIQLKFQYEGEKAWSLRKGHANESFVAQTLITDLDVMRVPHPKRTSIALESDGCISFFWSARQHSVRHYLHRNSPQALNEYKR